MIKTSGSFPGPENVDPRHHHQAQADQAEDRHRPEAKEADPEAAGEVEAEEGQTPGGLEEEEEEKVWSLVFNS